MIMSNYIYAENGRKGGIARAKKYYKKIEKVVMLFYFEPHLTQKQIAERLGVSQSFVSTHTKDLTKLYLTDKDETLKRVKIIIDRLSLEMTLEKPTQRPIKKINKV